MEEKLDEIVTLEAELEEEGASLVEYALLLALIAVVCIAVVSALGNTVSENFSSINNAMSGS